MEDHLVDYSHDRREESNLPRSEKSGESSSSQLPEQQQGLAPAGGEALVEQRQQDPIRAESGERPQQGDSYSSHGSTTLEPVISGQICR
jgi:hypothetical protein